MYAQRRVIVRLGLSTLLIVSLVALMVKIFGEPAPSAYNARTLSQLHQYVNALELFRSEKGTYLITSQFVCLGDYADDACWDKRGRGVAEDVRFNDLLDNYVPLLSSGPMVDDETFPEEGREGYIYRSLKEGGGYEIQFVLAGRKKRCGFGSELSLSVIQSQKSQNTLCAIVR